MKPSLTRIPGTVLVGLILAVVLDTLVQVTWKLAVLPVAPDASIVAGARAVLASPCFYVAMLGFGAQLVVWLRVLVRADLSFAQPITALSCITVLVVSRWLLHEPITVTRLVGVAFILIGVYFISQTPYRTPLVAVRARAPSDALPP